MNTKMYDQLVQSDSMAKLRSTETDELMSVCVSGKSSKIIEATPKPRKRTPQAGTGCSVPVPLDRSDSLCRHTEIEDLLSSFLTNKSPQTIEAYKKDLHDFRQFLDVPTIDDASKILLSRGWDRRMLWF